MTPADFIKEYEKALGSQDWKNVQPLMHVNVCITFSDGSIHRGKQKVQTAFERNFELIKNEEYFIQNIEWLIQTETIAIYTFKYNWKGIVRKQSMEGTGNGTSVLIHDKGRWLMITENLSK